ncbi:hypothetical protein G9C85_10195 [Halorubellus sp. JP-L1]|uniref:hypothetical protein n=1 Tax=Halorubellus sp. JP-L1 TaxID=2715753 RepID=UPI00140C34FB|nr:hypothetical protein [Halorubellus sp. JP-L1]NHN41996.1 hypothetical protein [Halorubellus sp. JP-L1]
MDAAAKAAALWGLVGALAFLVLHQGYVLLGNDGIGMLPAIGVAVLVGVVATGASYVGERYFAARKR